MIRIQIVDLAKHAMYKENGKSMYIFSEDELVDFVYDVLAENNVEVPR